MYACVINVGAIFVDFLLTTSVYVANILIYTINSYEISQ